MKKLLNNIPWKEWKTRKFTFIFALVVFVTYTTVCMIMQSNGLLLDSTLTTEVIGFLKWVVTTGVLLVLGDKGIKLFKLFKGVDGTEDE